MKLRIKKLIQRHVSSLFLLSTALVLLGLAFLISLKTGSSNEKPMPPIKTPAETDIIEEISTCSEDAPLDEQRVCFDGALAQSEALTRTYVNELLTLEPDTTRRIAFFEAQRAWEESRDANCAFVSGLFEDPEISTLEEVKCLLEFNVMRLEQLSAYRCKWNNLDGCEESNP